MAVNVAEQMRGCPYWSGTKEVGVKKNLGKVNL